MFQRCRRALDRTYPVRRFLWLHSPLDEIVLLKSTSSLDWWRRTRRGIARSRLIETMVRGADFGRLPCFPTAPIGSKDFHMTEKLIVAPAEPGHPRLSLRSIA